MNHARDYTYDHCFFISYYYPRNCVMLCGYYHIKKIDILNKYKTIK